MGVPTEDELKTALNEAARMREQDDDPQFLGKTLLNHHYRLGLLEKVLFAADLYLHSGHGASEHANLLKAIEKAKQSTETASDSDELDFGL